MVFWARSRSGDVNPETALEVDHEPSGVPMLTFPLGVLLKSVYFDQLGQVSCRCGFDIFGIPLTDSDDATISDRKRLKEDYGIKTIMDLRTVYNAPESSFQCTL